MKETVRLDVSVQIDVHVPDYDTGLTVEEWNDLTDSERGEIAQDAWNEVADRDNGGISVITEGAVEV